MVRLFNIAIVFTLLLLVGCSSTPSKAVGENVSIAFKAYEADNIDGALTILHEIPVENDFDNAYVQRFIGVMYAVKGDNNKAIDALKIAIEAGVLKRTAQGESLKLLADLQFKNKVYKDAIVTYQKWMDTTGKEDAATFVKIASAYTELQQQYKVIASANKAIKAYGNKQIISPYILKINAFFYNKNYIRALEVAEVALQIFPDNKKLRSLSNNLIKLAVKGYSKPVYKNGKLVSRNSTLMVRMVPKYPRNAVKQLIEGWVQLSFDINKAGKPINIKVIKAQPQQIFDMSAIKAVSKWKYSPKIENGMPIVQKGLSTQLDYKLSK